MKINTTLALALLFCTSLFGSGASSAHGQAPKPRSLYAEIYAIDCAFYNNRLGAIQSNGKIYALASDTVPGAGGKGYVLRNGKRPRPLVLRMNVGDTLTVKFTNYLQPHPSKDPAMDDPAIASLHASGVGLKGDILSDGSWVGVNPESQANPGETLTYRWTAEAEGVFLMYSQASDALGKPFSSAGQLADGLFGAIVVEPRGAEYYRSQVTAEDLKLATDKATGAINYQAEYPVGYRYPGDTETNGTVRGPGGKPILNMLAPSLQPGIDFEFARTDLTALITGPAAKDFPKDSTGPSFEKNPSYPERWKPWREFSIFYHDDFVNTQAFPPQGNPNLPFAGFPITQADNFAINYGIAGIVPTIFANRMEVGPQRQAVTAKFEEFFLSSWACGDPAMPVNIPANNAAKTLATYALYPDDPSNVYHSYMNDHVKFRILHAGSNLTHVHHLHAHQWLRSAASDQSHYLDSQTISPGASDTLDIVYGGSGNKNKTVGDSIFHCHFYPHFAGGMWALWRVHDVFEEGTPLLSGGDWPKVDVNANGGWVRALPDNEIFSGTPIPAIVPVPTIALAPKPAKVKLVPARVPDAEKWPPAAGNPVNMMTAGWAAQVNDADLDKNLNPGFPFYIPGVAGQRPPHPPLDFALNKGEPKEPMDGGLPRHLVLSASAIYEQHSHADFTKEIGKFVQTDPNNPYAGTFEKGKATALQLPEGGTEAEWVAMKAHATRFHDTNFPDGTPALGNQRFTLNGKDPVFGAPFAEPYIDIDGNTPKPELPVRRYKAANIQLDVVFNKKGWHYPQQRIIALWDDIKPTLQNTRAPEPFFFRANSGEVIEFWHTNLVPNYYEWDNFQVRTPTDIIGQHIHLVKFDVTASDGAANGFNYEDGTFSPQEVQELIDVINHGGHLCTPPGFDYLTWLSNQRSTYQWPVAEGTWTTRGPKLEAKAHPVLGPGMAGQNWLGAQTTIQRWYADPVFDNKGNDRTLRTVFTHDHFGPTTHQQAGLYAGLLVEPAGTKWLSNTDPNLELGKGRGDGGPTSWEARIVDEKDAAKSFREFALEFGDTQLTYQPGSKKSSDKYVFYKPGAFWGDLPPPAYRGWTIDNAPPEATGVNTPGDSGQHTPIYSQAFNQGSYVVNYRSEPMPFRVNTKPPGDMLKAKNPEQAASLAYAYSSISRYDGQLNTQPAGGTKIAPGVNQFEYPAPFAGAKDFDPYTPLLRAQQGDNVQIRTLVGSQIAPHSFTIDGLPWLYEPDYAESGYINAQTMGISEHFEMEFQLPFLGRGTADYLYRPSSGADGFQKGLWGLLRSYPNSSDPSLPPLLNPANGPQLAIGVPDKVFEVYAVNLRDLMNPPAPDMVIYVSKENLIVTPGPTPGTIKCIAPKYPSVAFLPLILRCNAGDVVKVKLFNFVTKALVPSNWGSNPVFTKAPNLVSEPLFPTHVGLDVQMLAHDPVKDSGLNVGANNVVGGVVAAHLVPPPKDPKPDGSREVSFREYTWYAGKIDPKTGGRTPIEFGAVNLLPADHFEQQSHGLIGALIVEPAGSTFRPDYQPKKQGDPRKEDAQYINPASGTVESGDGKPLFREFVAVVDDNNAVVGGTSINYQTAPFTSPPLGARTNPGPNGPVGLTATTMFKAVSDYQLNPPDDPPTPVYAAAKGSPVRLRLLHPGGSGNDMNFALHGHVWQEEPWQILPTGSLVLGNNPKANWQGSHDRFGPNTTFNLLLGPGKETGGAGGVNRVTGDYLLRDFFVDSYAAGGWGILRVGELGKDVVSIINYPGAPGSNVPPAQPNATFVLSGRNTVHLASGEMATNVTVKSPGLQFAQSQAGPAGPWFNNQLEIPVDTDGRWAVQVKAPALPAMITVSSPQGGSSSVVVSPQGGGAVAPLARIPRMAPPVPPDAMKRQSPQAVPK